MAAKPPSGRKPAAPPPDQAAAPPPDRANAPPPDRANAPPPDRPAAAPPPDRPPAASPLVGVIMGSRSDWPTMKPAADTLAALDVPHEVRVVSAHRTPDLLFDYAAGAEARGLRVIIAGAGGAAHLPGMVAAKTVLPVLGVPVQSRALNGLDSLLSIAQMPGGVPVGTLAIGAAGATNAALLAARILGIADAAAREAVRAWTRARTEAVLADSDPRDPPPPPSDHDPRDPPPQ